MTVAIAARSDEETAEALVDQARRFDARAEAMKVQARELQQEAGRLRAQAQSILRPRLEILPTAYHSGRDTRTRARILAMLGDFGRCTLPQITRHLEVKYERARTTMMALEEDGEVARLGVGAGTVYALASEVDPAEVSPKQGSAKSMIRDAARTLDVFSYDELKAECAVLSDSSLRKYLPQLVEEGVLSSERMDRSLTKVYAYNHPTADGPASRQKVPTPEAEIVMRERNREVSGTGKTARAGGAIVNELLREIRAFPEIEVVKTKHAYQFRRNGQILSNCSRTPGASSLAGTRKKLRAAGVMVRA